MSDRPDHKTEARARAPMSHAQHLRALLVLGLPLIGGHLAQFAIGMTDTIMMGWYSVEGLAAVTLASTFFFVIFIFGSGFAQAVMPLVAVANAEGDETQVRRSTRMGLWMSLGFAVLTLPLFWFSEGLLLALGQTEELARDAQAYLRIAGWGIIPALGVMVMKSFLAALERTQVVLWITIVAALANALANYAFIFGNWGAPELGIRGSALASVAVQALSMLLILLYTLRALPSYGIFTRLWRPDWEAFRSLAQVGVPIGFTMLAEVGLFAAATLMMGWLGTIPLAAHGVALSLSSATFMVHMGLSNAATVRAGTALGRRDVLHLVRGARVVIALSLTLAFSTIAVFVLFPEPLISLYLDADEPDRAAILASGAVLLIVAGIFQMVDAAQVIGLGLLRGLKDTKVPMIFAAVSYWGIGVPCSYVLGFPLGYGGAGIWAGLAMGLTVASVCMLVRFWRSGPRMVAAGRVAEAS